MDGSPSAAASDAGLLDGAAGLPVWPAVSHRVKLYAGRRSGMAAGAARCSLLSGKASGPRSRTASRALPATRWSSPTGSRASTPGATSGWPPAGPAWPTCSTSTTTATACTGWAAFNRLKAAGLLAGAFRLVRTPSGAAAHLYFAGTDQRSGSLPGQHLDFKACGGCVTWSRRAGSAAGRTR